MINLATFLDIYATLKANLATFTIFFATCKVNFATFIINLATQPSDHNHQFRYSIKRLFNPVVAG